MRLARVMGTTLATGALLGALMVPSAASAAVDEDGPDAGADSELSTSMVTGKSSGRTSEINCYDLAWNATHNHGNSAWRTATDACNDVNIRLRDSNTELEARVCFEPTSGGTTCNGWQDIDSTSWTEIAWNVIPGTTYRVETRGSSGTRYQYAA